MSTLVDLASAFHALLSSFHQESQTPQRLVPRSPIPQARATGQELCQRTARTLRVFWGLQRQTLNLRDAPASASVAFHSFPCPLLRPLSLPGIGPILIRSCVANLRSQARAPDRILIVDNGSTDDTGQIAAAPGVHYIPLTRNLGFAAAVNEGITQAGTDWILILNNDVALAPDWLERLPQYGRGNGR